MNQKIRAITPPATPTAANAITWSTRKRTVARVSDENRKGYALNCTDRGIRPGCLAAECPEKHPRRAADDHCGCEQGHDDLPGKWKHRAECFDIPMPNHRNIRMDSGAAASRGAATSAARPRFSEVQGCVAMA